MKDFVPMVGYGGGIGVPALTTVYTVLYPLPDYSGMDAEFLLEDEEEQSLFLERVVGEVYCAFDVVPPTEQRISWCLMPLGVNYDTLAPLEPFTSPWSPDDSEWNNVRWWQKRQCVRRETLFLRPDEDPYWVNCDFRPRQMMGARRNLWPVLAVRNHSSTIDSRAFHYLRALYK